MKLKSARIKNLKLLTDLSIDFSTDPKRPLTVIRAENASGKTSTLMALRWALYGKDGLTDEAIRLSPTSWPEGQPCDISVQLDFSHTSYNVIAGERVGTTTDYRLVRSVTERPEGDHPNRGSDRTLLYRINDGGLEKVEPPDLLLGDMIPAEMKDIFFTDGDAAMTFISPRLSKGSRRDHVRDAIRSLLGLGLLEGAAAHVAESRKRANAEVSKLSNSEELTRITGQLSAAGDLFAKNTERLREVERQVEELLRQHDEADKRLQLALQAGDFNDLAEQQAQARSQLTDARDSESPLKQRHQQLLQDERISLAILRPTLEKGFAELAKLHEAGVIPSGSVPVLEERLTLNVCICGTPLLPGSSAREHVEHLIDHQRTVDDSSKVLTELHHATKVDLQRASSAASAWLSDLSLLERTRLNNHKVIDSAQSKLQVVTDKIGRIDKDQITECRKNREALQAALTAKQDERYNLQTDIDQAHALILELGPRQAELRRKDLKLNSLNDRLTVIDDMATVVGGALDDLQQIYLSKVSDRMNSLFLEMVGADPVSMAEHQSMSSRTASEVFTKAAITQSYEIVVNSGDRTLNPEHELNGASKRALTFSFIWALTEVSQVIAPRIIDTPLGMMSGLVKRRVLELITTPTGDITDTEKQVVLLLTRDEIRGVETIIDSHAGRIMTLTNTDQFPIDLSNSPAQPGPMIVRCDCNHRQYCHTCARRNDHDYQLTERPLF